MIARSFSAHASSGVVNAARSRPSSPWSNHTSPSTTHRSSVSVPSANTCISSAQRGHGRPVAVSLATSSGNPGQETTHNLLGFVSYVADRF